YNKLDFPALIGANKIVICNLAQHDSAGDVDLSALIAQTVLKRLLATMNDWGTVKDPETGEMKGTGCRVFIDEAPSVIQGMDEIPTILAESRKWGLGVCSLCQFPAQYEEVALRDAMYANTATKVAF